MEETKEPYQIEHHIHRSAIWAAARASQRGFTSVIVLRDALEQSGIVEFVPKPYASSVGAAQFRELHQEWCRSIIRFLERRNSAATYERAAKLVAVYLKTRVVLPHAESKLARVAHPPVDSILLRNISPERPESVTVPQGLEENQMDSAKRGFVLLDDVPTTGGAWRIRTVLEVGTVLDCL